MIPSIKASCPDPEAGKHPQTISLPPPFLAVGMGFLQWNAVFLPDIMGPISSKKLPKVHQKAPESTWMIIKTLGRMLYGHYAN
jgi:hypothetical protein